MENACKKPKLPRKRKKAAIKSQGRKWYHDNIKLYRITKASGMFSEPVCKFWVNSKTTLQAGVGKNGNLAVIPTPTQYW
jgi:hypothetical protein